MRPDPYAWGVHAEATLPLFALVAVYAVSVRRTGAPRWRIVCFAGGLLLLLATAVSPLESLQYHRLSMHLLQNVVLAEWAPALVVLGVPADAARRLGRVSLLRLLTRPWVALPLWLATYALWHLPPAYDTALEHDALLHLEHATYFVTGALMWWAVLQDDPWRLSDGARAAYVFAAFVLASPIGLMLALVPSSVYRFYDESRLWGLSPLADQQIAGVTMATEQAVVFFAVFVVYFARFMRAQEAG